MERIHSSKVCIATPQDLSTSIYPSVPLIHLSDTQSYIYPSLYLLSIYLHSLEYIIHMYVYPQITKDYRTAYT